MELKVTVAPEEVDSILAKLEKFTKKAEKLGVPPLTLTVSAPYVKKGKWVSAIGGIEVDTEKVLVDLTLEGAGPKLNGWGLAARLDWIENEAVFMKVPKVTLTKDWSAVKNLCEHCGTLRKRTETFIVQSDTGEEKQVGSDCLIDFLGHNAEAIFGFYCDLIGETESWGEFSSGSRFLVMERFLVAVASEIREFGWKSRGAVYATGGTATADSALVLLSDLKNGKVKQSDALKESDFEVAKASMEWARTVLASKEPKSDYEKNLVLVLKNDYLSPKHVGIAASVIPAFKKYLGAEAEKKSAALAPSEFQGEVKKRTVFKGLAVIFMKEFPSQFGVTTLVKFKDAAGNVYVWFASGEKDDLDIGKSYDVKATVKAHELYGDVKQTVLTRAVVL